MWGPYSQGWVASRARGKKKHCEEKEKVKSSSGSAMPPGRTHACTHACMMHACMQAEYGRRRRLTDAHALLLQTRNGTQTAL